MRTIEPSQLKPRLTSGEEIAFIDVREAGQHGEGHPFFSINVPYSRLEIDIEALVPRKSVAVVVMDDGDGVSGRAAGRLEGLGYSDVSVLSGGAPGWQRAGFTLFKGVNVPSKAFGEIVEHELHTPSISAEEYKAMVDRGERHVIFDGRTPAEYRRMTIPGSRSMPNAELPHRMPSLLGDDTTTIVINCAGRTRSIIGAENLRRAGFKNPIVALRNGTQGWMLAGFELERGSDPGTLGPIDSTAADVSRQRGRELASRYALPSATVRDLERWRSDASRTTFLLDVRSREEFEAGHLPGAVHAPGGQLVQATDQWVGTRGARLLLCDDTGLRAAITAFWLRGMGHDAVLLDEDVTTAGTLERGAASSPRRPAIATLDAADARRRFAEGARLIDVNGSMAHRKGHIAGAVWAIRPRLEKLGLRRGDKVVLVGDDRAVAELAARDLGELGVEVCGCLSAAPGACEAAGFTFASSPDKPAAADCIDYLFFVHDRHDGNLDAARAYLSWEVGLLDQMDSQEKGILKPLVPAA